MDFAHFVITQFNLRFFPKSDNNDYEDWLIWTRNRIELFKQYCLPSFVNQSNKEFTWLLYFDQKTPKEFLPFIEELNAYGFIEVCYADGADNFFEAYRQDVGSRTPEGCDWVITSRVDNDDCIHKDYIESIQRTFVKRENVLISCASGYTYSEKTGFLSHYFYPQTPFLSYIESSLSPIKGVFYKPHTKWKRLNQKAACAIYHYCFKRSERSVIFIAHKPLWIQLVHGQNVSNSFYRGLPILRKKGLHDFALDKESKAQSILSVSKYAHYVLWKRYIRIFYIKLFTGNKL